MEKHLQKHFTHAGNYLYVYMLFYLPLMVYHGAAMPHPMWFAIGTLGAKRNCRRVNVASCSTELSRKRQRCTKTDLENEIISRGSEQIFRPSDPSWDTNPENPCMVYLPTFPIKINQM